MDSAGWKRFVIVAIGWLFIILGIVGLFIPFLQGILFLLIGLVILSTEYHWARRLLEKVSTRFPRLGKFIEAAHVRATAILGHPHKETGAD